jgi:hypothetical protein
MSRRAQENMIAAALLVLFAAVIWMCHDFGQRARMIPLPLAVFGIVLTLIQLVWQNIGSTDELQMDLIAVDPLTAAAEEEAKKSEGPRKRVTWRDELRALGIVGALFVLVMTLGILPAVFLFTGGYFFVSREYSWRASLIYTSLLTAAIYLLFEVALQIQPYYGLLAPLFERIG